jgi:glucose-6-phosphate isomerase
MKKLKEVELWEHLALHAKEIQKTHLQKLFQNDASRFHRFSFTHENHLFDFSKNFITQETLDLFIELAQASELTTQIEYLFQGRAYSMHKPAGLHTALRCQGKKKIYLHGRDITEDIQEELEHMKYFVTSVLDGEWLGFSHKPITDVVNIGIGGSDLGPSLLTEALTHYKTHLNVHFVSNGDGIHAFNLTKTLNPETTLFIVVSKTFSTKETFINANVLLQWFREATGHSPFEQHVIGVSANPDRMKQFGIPAKNQFCFWDFIGGRFSVWSSVGLASALAIGFNNFNEFLLGGHNIDEHFYNSELRENIPFILALLDVFYIQFWDAQTRAIIPYHSYLKKFPAYLQQLSMESLGKSVNKKAQNVDYSTGNIIWGELGSNGQHAFYQLLHQGTLFVPLDFIVPMHLEHNKVEPTNFILANAIGQAEALMQGKNEAKFYQEMDSKGVLEKEINESIPHRTSPGNRPSTMILLSDLSPRTMGQLFALYEHKIFVQSVLWNINPFDQWGVELGKELAEKYLEELQPQVETEDQLINYVKRMNYKRYMSQRIPKRTFD